MRDRRAERIHRKNVRRARWRRYHAHNGGASRKAYRGAAEFATGRQGSVRTAKSAQWVGSDRVQRDGFYEEIQAKKERRRRWHEANRIRTAALLLAKQAALDPVRIVEVRGMPKVGA